MINLINFVFLFRLLAELKQIVRYNNFFLQFSHHSHLSYFFTIFGISLFDILCFPIQITIRFPIKLAINKEAIQIFLVLLQKGSFFLSNKIFTNYNLSIYMVETGTQILVIPYNIMSLRLTSPACGRAGRRGDAAGGRADAAGPEPGQVCGGIGKAMAAGCW